MILLANLHIYICSGIIRIIINETKSNDDTSKCSSCDSKNHNFDLSFIRSRCIRRSIFLNFFHILNIANTNRYFGSRSASGDIIAIRIKCCEVNVTGDYIIRISTNFINNTGYSIIKSIIIKRNLISLTGIDFYFFLSGFRSCTTTIIAYISCLTSSIRAASRIAMRMRHIIRYIFSIPRITRFAILGFTFTPSKTTRFIFNNFQF